MINFTQNSSSDIVIHNLTLKYENQLLFDQLNIFFPRGKWTILLGASGVGKSTLLKSIADLPTGVQNKIPKGAIVSSDNEPLNGRISYMAQQDLLMPWLTVQENCLLSYRLQGKTVAKQQVDQVTELLQQAGLQGAEKTRVQALSGGMRQRVSLVRTLLDQKPFVLMDEPFSSLDSITRLKMQDLATNWLRGKTVLMVTHDPLEALRIADRIYILMGKPVQLIECPVPEAKPPRSLTSKELLISQGKLLSLLAQNLL